MSRIDANGREPSRAKLLIPEWRTGALNRFASLRNQRPGVLRARRTRLGRGISPDAALLRTSLVELRCFMSVYRSHSIAAVLIAFLLVACSSKEPAPPPAAQTARKKPSQPPATAPAATDMPKTDSKTSPPSSPRTPEGSGATAGAATPDMPEESSLAAPPSSRPSQEKQLPAVSEVQPAAPQKPVIAVSQAETKPASSSQPAKAAPKDVVVLKASLGGVRFEHKLHSETRKITCETCHHASRPEKSATAAQQACGQCHTSVAAAPMKTKLQAAFHNPTATAGICIDCHKAGNAKGKAAPVKCLDCHKKENK